MPSGRLRLVYFQYGNQGRQRQHGIKELAVKLKSVYFRGLLSPLRNCATAHIIVLSALVETAVTLDSSSYLCENLGSMFNSVHL